MTGRRWLVHVDESGGILSLDASLSAVSGTPDLDREVETGVWSWYTDEQLAYLHARRSGMEPYRFLPGLEGPCGHPAYYPVPGALRRLPT